MTKPSLQKPASKPQRILTLVAVSSDPNADIERVPSDFEWGILVDRLQLPRVLQEEAESTINQSTVFGWFPEKWRPREGPLLDKFVKSLRFASVTQYHAPENLHRVHGKVPGSASADKVKAAIKLLVESLSEEFLQRGLSLGIYSEKQIDILARLAIAAIDADGIIVGARMPFKFSAWRESARFLHHDIKRLLFEAGHANPGVSELGPAVSVVKQALKAIGDGDQTEENIRNALRQGECGPVNVTRLAIELKYPLKTFVA